MKYFLLLLAIAALAVTGCKSDDDNMNNGMNNGMNNNGMNGMTNQSRTMPN